MLRLFSQPSKQFLSTHPFGDLSFCCCLSDGVSCHCFFPSYRGLDTIVDPWRITEYPHELKVTLNVQVGDKRKLRCFDFTPDVIK